jgi:hypothetical protein
LFVEAGPLELMSEELWPGAQAAASQQQQHQQPEQQQDGQQAGDVLSNSTVVGRSDGSSATSVPALARLAEATAAADSDDEEGAADPSDCALEHAAARAAGAAGTAGPTAARAADAWEGASETGSEGSGSSLVAFDLQDDLSAEQWWGPDGLGPVDSKALGLRTIAAALRKQDDMWGALEALKKVGVEVSPGTGPTGPSRFATGTEGLPMRCRWSCAFG